MRISELYGKEIINMNDGVKLNIVDECELLFDEKSGKISSILLPAKHSLFPFLSESKAHMIPWRAIKKIGNEIIIIDMNAHENNRYLFNTKKTNL
ncbi:YlmC/YmxH family sporulation protein [Anaerosinus massiliensis]|uniref:YlmC/YmxH family sporulation protein n=1 Tax=Massilibacillus massiliensis TaxID=1806837 RepID=UPI000DA61FBB|nr:YlmC/YmxH family sporulation protein [Massilibacillus massiliensis]